MDTKLRNRLGVGLLGALLLPALSLSPSGAALAEDEARPGLVPYEGKVIEDQSVVQPAEPGGMPASTEDGLWDICRSETQIFP
ncbi:hypothetical protein BJ991_002039 [Microbacterium immunditiarum]|uniref:Uncharacterized protein n=1 Tax=Microbacterium immunditiarum TaxID=337480 RepID=A0A7Y9GP19_9MICO|nr:hypothetical protein [Microbacterium immunditiarum]